MAAERRVRRRGAIHAGVAAHPTQRAALGLGPDSRVLLVISEGAAAPEAYRRITGLTPEQVRGVVIK